MKRRIVMLVATAAVSGVLTMFSPASPAQAVDACAGLGTAHLSVPFVYPVIGGNDTSLPGTATLSPRSAAFTFHLDTGTCLPSMTNVSAGGSVHGWCGLSTGSGTTNNDASGFAFIGIGGTLVITGGAEGAVNAIPNTLAGDSCVSGADDFLVNGVAVTTGLCAPGTHPASVDIPDTNVSVSSVVHGTTHGGWGPRVADCV